LPPPSVVYTALAAGRDQSLLMAAAAIAVKGNIPQQRTAASIQGDEPITNGDTAGCCRQK